MRMSRINTRRLPSKASSFQCFTLFNTVLHIRHRKRQVSTQRPSPPDFQTPAVCAGEGSCAGWHWHGVRGHVEDIQFAVPVGENSS